MSSLPEIWDELFEAAPTPLEQELMGNLARLIDPDDTSFILCALVVRFLNQSLLLDPGSPVNIAGRLNNTLIALEARSEKLDIRLSQLHQIAGANSLWISDLYEAVEEATSIAKRCKIPAPVLEIDRNTGSPYWQHTLAPNALWKFGLLAFVGGGFGTITGIAITLVLS